MEVNNIEKIIVLSTRVFNTLWGLAQVGASESSSESDLSECAKHVRKFNSSKKEEHANSLLFEKQARDANKAAFRKYVRENTGKEVYVSVAEDVKIMGTLLGRGLKDCICIKLPDDIAYVRNCWSKKKIHVPIRKIQIEELSEAWILVKTGIYKGYYVHYSKILAEKIQVKTEEQKNADRLI